MSDFLTLLLVLLGLLGIVVLGFWIPPRPFRAHPRPSAVGAPTPIRPDLPEMVRRHFVDTIGENPPAIESAVIWGRGKLFIRGVWFPMRFKAWYYPGDAFSRRMEITWYQRPIFRGIDSYLNGEGVLSIGGRVTRGRRINQGNNLTLWSNAIWMPSTFVHDPRITWQPIDEHAVRLVFPFEQESDEITAHFDPETKRMTHFTAMRIASDGNGVEEKEPWRMDLLAWKDFGPVVGQGVKLLLPCQISMARGETGSPWSYWTVEGLAYNVNVSDQLGNKNL